MSRQGLCGPIFLESHMNQAINPMVTGKVAVLARDSNGAPDLVFYDISCSKTDRAKGLHYDEAERRAVSDGYDPVISFDDFDPAWSRIQLLSENRELALNMLMHGLTEIGFGSDNPIDGADCVDSVGDLYDQVVNEVLQGKKNLPLSMILKDEAATAMAVAEVAGIKLVKSDQPGCIYWTWRANGKECSEAFDEIQEAAVHAMRSTFKVEDWRDEVAAGETIRGYLDWAYSKAEEAANERELTGEGA
jgi:hypothetical protein